MDGMRLAVWGVVFLGGFVWMGFALAPVLAKLGISPGSAWIPIARYVAAARAAELPTAAVWATRSVAAVGWLVVVGAAMATGADGTGSSPALGGFAATGLVFGLAGSLGGWLLWIVGANRIELRLVVERRLWWLAAAVPPLWATIIGFGPARPVVAGPVAGSTPEPEPIDDDATRAIERVTLPLAPPPAATDAPLAGEVSMTIDDYDLTGEYPRAFSPYDKAVAPGGAHTALDDHSVHPVEPWEYDDDDTIFTQRRRARWILQVVGGEEYDLEDITTIGREGIRPIPGVLPIVDDTRTMSKLHARLRRESENWFITDLGSTNGTYVRDPAGAELEVKAQSEAKVNGILLLGDLEVVIVDQREVA